MEDKKQLKIDIAGWELLSTLDQATNNLKETMPKFSEYLRELANLFEKAYTNGHDLHLQNPSFIKECAPQQPCGSGRKVLDWSEY